MADEHEHHRAGEHARRARVPQSAPRQSPKRGRRTAAAGIGSGAGGIGGSSCASFVAGCLRSTRSTPFCRRFGGSGALGAFWHAKPGADGESRAERIAMAPSYRPLLLAVLGFGLANVAAGNSSSTAPASLPSSVPPARTLAPARPPVSQLTARCPRCRPVHHRGREQARERPAPGQLRKWQRAPGWREVRAHVRRGLQSTGAAAFVHAHDVPCGQHHVQ